MATKKHKFTGILSEKRAFGSDEQYGELTPVDKEYIDEDNARYRERYPDSHLTLAMYIEMTEAVIREMRGQFNRDNEMLHELSHQFGINADDKDGWKKLSIELARMDVPGFQYEKAPRGRKQKWDFKANMKLRDDVDALLKRYPNWQVIDACNHLSDKGTFGSISGRSLQNRYIKAKKKVRDLSPA